MAILGLGIQSLNSVLKLSAIILLFSFIYQHWQYTDTAPASAWHNPELFLSDGSLVNFVCEIPRLTTAKMELSKTEPHNPIKQDRHDDNQLRFYHSPILWNYGFLPRTWEDPKGGGDNDPLDVVELGTSILAHTGDIYAIKFLCVYAMIDNDEIDYKIVAIRADDPLASRLHDVESIERELPGELFRIFEWFRDYKIPDGKPANVFGYNNTCMGGDFTFKVIQEAHESYNRLLGGETENTGGFWLG